MRVRASGTEEKSPPDAPLNDRQNAPARSTLWDATLRVVPQHEARQSPPAAPAANDRPGIRPQSPENIESAPGIAVVPEAASPDPVLSPGSSPWMSKDAAGAICAGPVAALPPGQSPGVGDAVSDRVYSRPPLPPAANDRPGIPAARP